MKTPLIIFIFLFIFNNCASNIEYKIFNEKIHYNSESNRSLLLEFQDFKELPLLINIQIKKMKKISEDEIKCEEIILNENIKYNKENIKIDLERQENCVYIYLHYNTSRLIFKNEKADLKLDFNSTGKCLQQPKINSPYQNEYKCNYLDFTNKSYSIIFTNIPVERVDERHAILTWGTTLSSAISNPPFVFFTPIPIFLTGYITVKNEIKFDIF
ncbi:hypothetical protein [Leptospira jelokensis]|uniref:hypothetical protein n=1 Tax=Leptospira jelokensis TaxID=2484931 RepID=UPI001090B540|nr:hypothetical protein [Leptospira jelokensis]TGM06019.1 hypothetical protein EHQ79_02380 [Leptospira jelokensis]